MQKVKNEFIAMTTKALHPFFLKKEEIKNSSLQSCFHKHGLCVIPQFFTLPTLQQLSLELEGLKERLGLSQQGASKINFSDIERDSYPYLEKCLHGDPIHSLAKSFFSDKDFSFNQSFMLGHEFKNEGLALQNLLHFDRLPSLEFIIYLETCPNESFCIIPATHSVGALLREKAWEESTQLQEVKNRIFIDYPELGYEEKDCLFLQPKAGTLIAFNSDTFHFGGVSRTGVVRSLCEVKEG